MPTNYSSRILTITLVILAALWAIFPNPVRLFQGPFNEALNLKPGIDMVGGSSLTYEIKQPEGGYSGGKPLAEEVMDALKRRVDPDGLRNLVWRPSGNTQLEIQMPLTGKTRDATAAREAYQEAQVELESTNVRLTDAIRTVETLSGDARRTALDALSMGSDGRAQILGGMASVWDQILVARTAKDVRTEANLLDQYDALKVQLDATNLRVAQIESVLLVKDASARQRRVDDLKKTHATFPKRSAAMDQFVTRYAAYEGVRGSLDGASDLKRLLQGSGLLAFHILADDVSQQQVQEMTERLDKFGPRPRAGDAMQWFLADRPEEFRRAGRAVTHTYGDKLYVLTYVTPDKSLTKAQGDWNLRRAGVQQADLSSRGRGVSFEFDTLGARLFGELSSRWRPQGNRSYQLAIVLDDKIISAPNLNDAITTGTGVITGGEGGFSTSELNYLVNTLNAGSLPAKLADQPISERTIGPQLGEDNLRAGFLACIAGLIIVAIFLISYYYLSGLIATCAVMMNMVLILGAMAAMNATFTLPGVAGIVLTIGMAVDANVLIFERLREEQLRGLSLKLALRNAYDRAWSAILDSNVTTAISAAALYYFGSEEVKGFGLTLLIGILASLFTSLFVTRTIFGILIDRFDIQNLSSLPLTFPKWDRLLKPNIDWIGKAWMFYAFSIIFILAGLSVFFVQLAKGQLLDIEFAKGTSVQFELKSPMRIQDVRARINGASEANPTGLPAPSVVSVGSDDLMYEVVTPSENVLAVKEAVTGAMGDTLNVSVRAKFDGVGENVENVLGTTVLGVEAGRVPQVNGQPVPDLQNYIGGVAIILNNLNPALDPGEIKSRISAQLLQPGVGNTGATYRDFAVREFTSPEGKVTSAVVLSREENASYEADRMVWQEQLARPMWQTVTEAIDRPTQLQSVRSFDAQVAGQTKTDASIALVLSIVGIVGYVWLRFGDLKYGTATVVAMLHDMLFVLAAVGMAHLLADTFIGRALLIEPFRLNLTLVAAVLTVMGYSMNDTVVVFDRIRENRGRMGHTNRQVVNDSINQTLSRTILTGGTTLATIFVMYVWGGSGIHGFTYCMLVGIIAGTYSSIAIAAPILLLGGGAEAANKDKPPVGQLQGA